MAKVIIGIHGLGNKPPHQQLEAWWKEAICEGLKMNLGKEYEIPNFKLVYWADILYDYPQDQSIVDETDPLFLDETYTLHPPNFAPKPHPVRRKIMDMIIEQMDKIFLNKDLTINYSFIFDKLIHKYFKDLEAYYSNATTEWEGQNRVIKELIRERLKKTLEEHKKDEVFLIAHSMGSIVSYDVLTLFRQHVNLHTFATIGSPLAMPVVVGKIAGELKLRRPIGRHLKTPLKVGYHWYNFSDLEDKVAFSYHLRHEYDENENGIEVIDYEVHNDYEMKGKKNPHKSYGYLRTPEFSNVLYRFISRKPETVYRKIISLIGRLYGRVKESVENLD